MIKFAAVVLSIVLACGAVAQEESADSAARPLPLGDWLLSLPNGRIPERGLWEVKFAHRFNQSLSQGSFADQVHSLFGLDTNADVVFGASYALRPDLQVGLFRSNTNDTLEGAVKYVAFEQSATMPVTLAVRGGVDWRTERDLGDRTSFFAQAIVSRQFGRRAEIFLHPTIVTNAGRAVTVDGSGALFENAFNVPISAAIRTRGSLFVVAELIPPQGDLPKEMDGSDLGWSIGIKRAIGLHWFEILLTNNQATLTDQYVTSTFQGTGFDADDVRLGFNIERRFGRRR
ncbi:MAG TPA: DUF5777 family beta-barrel protein [Thermoanaerobaculia bacterium]|jgi:hypothetical protein